MTRHLSTSFLIRQHGISIVELMIAVTLGMLVVLAITGMVLSSFQSYATQSNSTILYDTARNALDNINRSVKQAGYINLDNRAVPFLNDLDSSAFIQGLDNTALIGTNAGITSSGTSKSHSSDVLALQYFGSGKPGSSDDTMHNCTGATINAPGGQNARADRHWTIYYVGISMGEPTLFCKYSSKKNTANRTFATVAIARGVESFQVLYGIDTDSTPDSIANRYMNATQVNALDAAILPAELNQKTHWKRVSNIKVALLIRSIQASGMSTNAENSEFNLFGPEYSTEQGSSDAGTQIKLSDISLNEQSRIRAVFNSTIQLRNAVN